MAFIPTFGKVATERCLNDTGWSISGDILVDGTCRLNPNYTGIDPDMGDLPTIPWEYSYKFNSATPDPQWTTHGSYTYNASEAFYSFQDSGDYLSMDGASYWYSLADPTTGYTLETKIKARRQWDGFSNDDNRSPGTIRIDDGTQSLDIDIDLEGIHVPYGGGEFVIRIPNSLYDSDEHKYNSWRYPVNLRLAVENQELTIGTPFSSATVTPNWSASSTKSLALGMLEGTGDFQLYSVDLYFSGSYWDGKETIAYNTGEQIAYTPAWQPSTHLEKFEKAVYRATHVGSGTTTITPQIRTDTGAVWTDKATTTITAELTEQTLNTSVGGGLTDQIRFKIGQASADGTTEPARVEAITVVASAIEGILKPWPTWGYKDGGNVVAFDIARAITGEFDDGTDIFFLGHTEDDIYDRSANDYTFTENGVLTKSSAGVQLIANDGAERGKFSGLLISYNPTGYGQQGSEITVVNGTGTNPALAEAKVTLGGVKNAQKVTAGAATRGVSITPITSLTIGNIYVLEYVLGVQSGQVKLEAAGATFTNAIFDRGSGRKYRSYFKATSTTVVFQFTANGGAATFTIGAFSCYSVSSSGYLSKTHEADFDVNEITLHSTINLKGYPSFNTPIASHINGSDGWEFGVGPQGYPYVTGGTDTLVGEVRIPIAQNCNVSASTTIVDGNTVFEVFVNGALAGHETMSGTYSGATATLEIGRQTGQAAYFFPGTIYGVRALPEGKSGLNISKQLALATVPKFLSSNEPELTNDTVVYAMFNRARGIIENKGTAPDLILPYVASDYTYRGAPGTRSNAIRFIRIDDNRFGFVLVPEFDTAFDLTNSFSIEGYAKVPVDSRERTLVSFLTTHGFAIKITSDGKLKYVATGADGTNTVTGSTTVTGSSFFHFGVYHNRTTDAVTIYVNGSSNGTATSAVGTMSTVPTRMCIGCLTETGEGINADLDSLRWESGEITTWTYPASAELWTPNEPVYIDGDLLHTTRVRHYSPERKLIMMPTHSVGQVPFRVGSATEYSYTPYTYVDGYHRALDTGDLEAGFGSMRSPFRILRMVPEHGIGLGYISATPLQVSVHMSLTDLSDYEAANRTGYGIDEGSLRNPTTGDFSFADAVDTDEFLVTNRAAMWRNNPSPKPLYYKYLVGRDRFYVSAPSAATTGDIGVIRDSIRVYEGNDTTASIAWDIAVSDVDYSGASLPARTYSLVLMTELIPSHTLWVEYQAVDRLNNFDTRFTKREIVNPVPIFGNGVGRMNKTSTLNTYGSYDVVVEV